MKKLVLLVILSVSCLVGYGQDDKKWKGKFEQLQSELPTPTEYRSASGAPGVKYWQQKADYVINAELNDENQSLTGSESITYYNNSPDVLKYLWLQLDQNILAKGNATTASLSTRMTDTLNTMQLYRRSNEFDGGHKIKSVKDGVGNALTYSVNQTMMRIELPQPLKTGEKFSFSIEWSYNIGDRQIDSQRSGWEYFPEDKNYIYTIAQWFPRMCVYDDVEGWQNKQFLGQGEFALAFGDYKVKLTVPSDHIVAATGALMNPTVALSKTQLERFEKAKTTFDKPTLIVTQAEAVEKEKTHATTKKTWEFQASNVRDFAFATSRKFIWDAQAVKLSSKTPLAMSFYPKEGNPLWGDESTKAVRNCLEIYSRYTLDYPYPVAISVNTANIGMEYPMICFNGGRAKKDGTVDPNTKWSSVAVIIHEVGHNFFPMIINNDERQWTWMDEGVNSFLQYRTEVERYENFPHWWGSGKSIAPFMKGDKSIQRPVMTNSENIVAFGAEQYAKVATSLSILRENIMGPELFDRSFKEYATRWAFKHPQPADFFRTMEDASAVDLDWFWRGWYYTTDHVDFELSDVKWYKMKKNQTDPEKKTPAVKSGDLAANAKAATDFSQGPKEFAVVDFPEQFYGEFNTRVDGAAVKAKLQDKNFYELTIKNKGGLIMPIVIEWTYKDGSKEIEKLPAESWRLNEYEFKKSFIKDKEVTGVVIDPNQDMAEAELADNVFPKKPTENKFEEIKKKN